MARPLHRIMQKFYGEPWHLHRPSYESLHRQLQARLTRRQVKALVIDDDDDDEDPLQPRAAANCSMDCLANIEIGDGVAIVPISGVIGKHLSMMEMLCGGYDIAVLQDQTLALQNRADVHTAVFRIDSPGGQSCAWPDAAQMIVDLGASGKRTIAYADLCACSAAYGLACACEEVHVGTGSMVGSIETIFGILDESKAFEMAGMKMDVFTTGAFKAIGYDGTSLTNEQRTWIQGQVAYLSTRFKDFVRSRRPKVKDEAMEGQWFTGEQAIEAGLADGIAPSIYHVIAAALQR